MLGLTDQLSDKKRLSVSFFILVLIPTVFWSISRYPDLVSELYRSNDNTLLNRDVGSMSKDEAIRSDRETEPTYLVILKTTLNWIDTNKIGMGFAILFGGAILAFMEQLSFLRRYLSFPGLKGSLVGMAFGAPLGVCTNCATPVGFALREKGASLETALSTMFASPMLNPIGLIIIFSVFPLELSMTRVIGSIVLIALVVPIISRIFGQTDANLETNNTSCAISLECEIPNLPGAESSWPGALTESLRSVLVKTWQLFRITVPLMLAAGLISAVILAYIPLESITVLGSYSLWAIVIAAAIGTLLPMPMFVDIILVLGLLELGLEKGPAAALLITLGPVSIFSASIIWRQISGRFATGVLCATCLLGIVSGGAISSAHKVKHYLYTQGILDKALYADTAQTAGVEGIVKTWPEPTAAEQPAEKIFGSGAAWSDYDNDGLLDLFVPSVDGNRLYRNTGDGAFEDVTVWAGLDIRSNSVSAVWADYDNDGDTDLYVVNYGVPEPGAPGDADLLYQNNGDGTFSDITFTAGINHWAHGMGAAWGDYNNDGYLDLYVANWGVWVAEEHPLDGPPILPKTNRSEHNLFYHNNGDGTFTEMAGTLGIEGPVRTNQLDEVQAKLEKEQSYESGHSFQPIWFDYDNNGSLDLFVATDYGVSYMYHNNGDATFSDVTAACGMDVGTFGMGVAVGDYDGDGYMDIYETNVLQNRFWRNNGDGTFKNVATKLAVDSRKGFGWGTSFIDYDNDSDLDLFVANGFFFALRPEEQTTSGYLGTSVFNLNRFYENAGNGGEYTDTTKDIGLWNGYISRGAALADYNNDGFTDIYVVNRFGANNLYTNSGNKNNWLTIQLVGQQSNRQGVGARVSVTTEDGRTQTDMVFAGSSFLSNHSPWLNFGLGDTGGVKQVTVHWPSGLTQTLEDIELNKKLVITEAASI